MVINEQKKDHDDHFTFPNADITLHVEQPIQVFFGGGEGGGTTVVKIRKMPPTLLEQNLEEGLLLWKSRQ